MYLSDSNQLNSNWFVFGALYFKIFSHRLQWYCEIFLKYFKKKKEIFFGFECVNVCVCEL